MSTIMKVN